MAGTCLFRLPHQSANRLNLMVARENQRPFARLATLVVLLLNNLNKMLDRVQDAIPSPDPLPEVRRANPLAKGGFSAPPYRP